MTAAGEPLNLEPVSRAVAFKATDVTGVTGAVPIHWKLVFTESGTFGGRGGGVFFVLGVVPVYLSKYV